MLFFLLIATFFFLLSICAIASVMAVVAFLLGVCVFAVAFLFIDSAFLFALILLGYAGFVAVMLLSSKNKKSLSPKYVLIASVPCLYIAYRGYITSSAAGRFSLDDYYGFSTFSDYYELFGLVAVVILCVLFLLGISSKNHNPPEDN